MSNVIKNVEIFWAKLDPSNPVDPFKSGKLVWEVQMRTADKAIASEWKKRGMKPKALEDNGATIYVCTVKKIAQNKKGQPLTPPRVVDAKLNPVDPTIIGNGSIVNLQVSPREWEMGGNSGVVFDLMAVQVIKLVEYTGSSLEFDVVDLGGDSSSDDAGLNDDFNVEDDDF